MNIENKINNQLNKFPKVKKIIKRSYQLCRYALSKKSVSEGNIKKISPEDDFEYFYGYYDKSPWSGNEKYMVFLKVKSTYKDVAPKEKAEIMLFDFSNQSIKKIAETSTWNVQQGCMVQWVGPDYNEKIIYNDYRDSRYCSVILTVFTGEEKIIDYPIYDVSRDGETALSLDFSRLHRLRPGYGYSNLIDIHKLDYIPNDTCIWRIDLNKNIIIPLLKYVDFYNFEQREEMINAEHKVNHLMISPNGKRFMVLHRWYQGSRKYTRLVTINIDGTEMYNLSDDNMVSHCFWKNDDEIIAFENKFREGNGYFLMKDRTHNYMHLWDYIDNDGHPSYSPNGTEIVIDSYPNSQRISTIKIMKEEGQGKTIANVFAPFKYDNDVRCDLHPRWDRTGNRVCFDACFEGKRGVYMIEVNNESKEILNSNFQKELVSIIIPTYRRSETLERAIISVLTQTYKNIEVLVIDDNEPRGKDSNYVKQIVSKFSFDQRVKYIGQEKHINGAVARNVGIKSSKGKYIAFLDDDDEWMEEKIEKQVFFLENNPNIDGVSTLYKIFNQGQEIRKCPIYNKDNLHKKVFLREVSVFTSTILLKRNKIEKMGLFNETLLRHQDLQFLLDFLAINTMDIIQDYLVVLHSDSEINHPTVEKMIDIKERFFKVCHKQLELYSKKEKKQILSAHYFEIVMLALKSKKITIAIKYLMKIGISGTAYRNIYKRWKSR